MALNDLLIAKSAIGVADTSREPSAQLWMDCPWNSLVARPASGVTLWEDFTVLPSIATSGAVGTAGQWSAWYGATTLTIADQPEEGGVIKIDTSTTDANKSVILTTKTSSFRFMGASTAYKFNGGRFWMEFRIALGSVAASQQGVFIGVADHTGGQINASDTTIIASGGNTLTTTKNVLGFFNRTTTCPSDFSLVYQPAAGTAVYPTGLTTPALTTGGAAMTAYAASTDKGQGTGFIKIGMRYNKNGPVRVAPSTCPSGQTAGTKYQATLEVFVNGIRAAAFLNPGIMQAATFPLTSAYAPVIQYMNVASGTAPIYLDWVRYAQEASF